MSEIDQHDPQVNIFMDNLKTDIVIVCHLKGSGVEVHSTKDSYNLMQYIAKNIFNKEVVSIEIFV